MSSEPQWAIQVTLTDGAQRVLTDSVGTAEAAIKALNAFMENQVPFRSDWLETKDGYIARAHIVEARAVSL